MINDIRFMNRSVYMINDNRLMIFENFDPKKETKKIIKFIKKTFKKQGFEKGIVAVSGGVDSATTLFLTTKALGLKNVIPVKLPYKNQDMSLADLAIKSAGVLKSRVWQANIELIVKGAIRASNCKRLPKNKVRLGNIMARSRMMLVYDLAKKRNALVVGTENRSEHLLGYYTRYGDEASDLEAIVHLYKTQVYQLAEYLKVPEEIVKSKPSAGLWPAQTDQKELGFSYAIADPVLHLYFDKKMAITKLKKMGYKKVEKVVKTALKNQFKHQAPYVL